MKWIGGKSNDHPGTVDVFIDGKFESNVSTQAESGQQRRQADLFVKTGLPDGPHVLKLVLKSDGYQDMDAFAYLAPAPREGSTPRIEGVTLPPQAPLLNPAHRYPVGNGVAVIVSMPDGQIHQAFGPGYTTSDLIHSEDLLLEVDGVEQPLRVPMKRAAGTGVFYGLVTEGDLNICMVDYACAGQPWISRLIVLKNGSGTAHQVVLRDGIVPFADNGWTRSLASDSAGMTCGAVIQADTTVGVPFGGNNPVDKSVLIAFSEPAATAFASDQGFTLQTKPMTLAPDAQAEVTLTHYFQAGHDLTNSACIDWSLSSVAMAAASVEFFSDYLKAAGGDPANYHNEKTNTTVNLDAEVKNLVAAMDRDFWRTDVPESPGGFHDFYRQKSDGAWPKARNVNFTLMPVFCSTPYAANEKTKDVAAMAALFDRKNGYLQLVPSAANGMEGHDLGYLLWDCVEMNDPLKEQVYQALVNGKTVDSWGAWSEAYNPTGDANGHDLRSLETGINLTALAKYWGLGK